jgi:hypothetical protein
MDLSAIPEADAEEILKNATGEVRRQVSEL